MTRTPEEILEEIREQLPKALLADGFEDAIIGTARRPTLHVVAYDYNKCVDILMDRDEMTRLDAIEWMEYNVVNAWVGDDGPVFIE